jgi:protein TonB
MPLNVRRFFACAALALFGFVLAEAQTTTAPPSASPTGVPVAPKSVAAPTSAEIMRERISKAKAFIAVKNYNAAIYELENIRRETGDQTVHGVINVLLMNSYLEQGDYARAQTFLKELSAAPKNGKPAQTAHYFSVAGQVVKGARNQLERYRALGLTVSDRSLPLEAAVDIEKMRETLELVVEQSKTIGADKSKSADAMALVEEATTTRGSLAKDDYDAKRWKDAVSDAREQLTSSRSVIVNAVNEPPTETAAVSPNTTASTNPVAGAETESAKSNDAAPVFKSVANENTTVKPGSSNTPNIKLDAVSTAANNALTNGEVKKITPAEQSKTTNETPRANSESTETAQNAPTPNRDRRVENRESENKAENRANNKPENKTEKSNETAKSENSGEASPLNVGSLVSYATTQAKPVYPVAAKNMRMTGVVKVEVLVNENGEVSQVQNTTGPSMLQRAATDAVKKWKFKPFVRDGQPTKASGFVNFNFSL